MSKCTGVAFGTISEAIDTMAFHVVADDPDEDGEIAGHFYTDETTKYATGYTWKGRTIFDLRTDIDDAGDGDAFVQIWTTLTYTGGSVSSGLTTYRSDYNLNDCVQTSGTKSGLTGDIPFAVYFYCNVEAYHGENDEAEAHTTVGGVGGSAMHVDKFQLIRT